MSYDTYIFIDTGGLEPACVEEVGNHTSNCSAMWTRALGFGLRQLSPMHGNSGHRAHDAADLERWGPAKAQTCAEAIPHLERAIADISDPANAEAYRALNPSNGWGSHDSATSYLRDILAACKRHPKAHLFFSF